MVESNVKPKCYKLPDRALHHVIRLKIIAQLKTLRADFDKPPPVIKRPRSWVVFPDGKPDGIVALLLPFIQAGLHQGLTDALPDPVLQRIDPRNLDWAYACDEWRGGVRVQFGV